MIVSAAFLGLPTVAAAATTPINPAGPPGNPGRPLDMRVTAEFEVQTSVADANEWTTIPGGKLDVLFGSYRLDAAATLAAVRVQAAAADASAQSAADSQDAASASAAAAAGSAGAASTSATAAAGSAGAASTSASAAAGSAGAASTSAGNARTSETNAAASAQAAATSASTVLTAGSVLFNGAQSLTAAQRKQAKANISAIGAGSRAAINANTALVTADRGKLIFLYGATTYTVTMPDVATCGDGDCFDFTCHGSVAMTIAAATVNSTQQIVNVPGGGSPGSVLIYPGQGLRLMTDGSSWIVTEYAAPFKSVPNVDIAQTFTLAQRQQLKKNIFVPNHTVSGYSANSTFDATHVGRTIFLAGGTAYTMPTLAQCPTDATIRFINLMGVPVTLNRGGTTENFFYAGVNTNSYILQPGADVTFQNDTVNWIVGANATTRTALMADRVQSFTAAEQAQLATNLGLVMPAAMQCRLGLTNITTLTLQPVTGPNVFIAGKLRQINLSSWPTLTIAGANPTLNVLYYVYAFWTGSAVSLTASTVAPVRDTTYGHMVAGGDPTASLVGMFYTVNLGSGTQFADVKGYRCVATYYHRLRKGIGVSQASGTTGSAITEFGTRCYFLSWGEDEVELGVDGYCYTPTYDNRIYYLAMDGTQITDQIYATGATNDSTLVRSSITVPAAMGLHDLRLWARSGGSTLYCTHSKVGSVIL